MPYIPTAVVTAAAAGGETELAYAQFTAPVTLTATSAATPTNIVSAGAVTFDGSTRVCIEFYSPYVETNVTAGSAVLNLWVGSTDLGRIGAVLRGAFVGAFYARRFLTPSAGSLTYKVTGFSGGSADSIVHGGAGGVDPAVMPGFIRITTADSV